MATKIGAQEGGKVYRFAPAERVAHWVHTICFFLLLLTGLAVFWPGGNAIASLFGGIQVARIVHRVVAFPYAIVALVVLFGWAPEQTKEWLRISWSWSKEDLVFVAGYMPELMGRHNPNLPEADKFNAGEKFNSILTLVTGFGLVVTGIIMWFPNFFPKWLVRLAYPFHDLSWLGMSAMLVIHIYLSVIHPRMRAALEGMISGWVDKEFAQEHYPKWYRRVATGAGKK